MRIARSGRDGCGAQPALPEGALRRIHRSTWAAGSLVLRHSGAGCRAGSECPLGKGVSISRCWHPLAEADDEGDSAEALRVCVSALRVCVSLDWVGRIRIS